MHAGVMMARYGALFWLFDVVSSCILLFVSWENAVILHMILAKAAKLMHGSGTGVCSKSCCIFVTVSLCLMIKGCRSHQAVDASQ